MTNTAQVELPDALTHFIQSLDVEQKQQLYELLEYLLERVKYSSHSSQPKNVDSLF